MNWKKVANIFIVLKIEFLPENRTFPQILYTFPRNGLGLSDDFKATGKLREF